MWKVISLLWLVPLATLLLMLARTLRGSPTLNQNERLFVFGPADEENLAVWWWTKFAGLLLLFFAAGLAQGLVLIAIGPGWLLAVPIVTGLAAMLAVVKLLR